MQPRRGMLDFQDVGSAKYLEKNDVYQFNIFLDAVKSRIFAFMIRPDQLIQEKLKVRYIFQIKDGLVTNCKWRIH